MLIVKGGGNQIPGSPLWPSAWQVSSRQEDRSNSCCWGDVCACELPLCSENLEVNKVSLMRDRASDVVPTIQRHRPCDQASQHLAVLPRLHSWVVTLQSLSMDSKGLLPSTPSLLSAAGDLGQIWPR